MSAKDVLGNMTWPRWLMVICAVSSVGLAANGWRLYSERTDLQTELAEAAPARAQDIQFLGKLYSKLQADAEREGFVTQDKPDLYFRGIATDEAVQLGQIDVDPASPRSFFKGTLDLTYTLRPQVNKSDVGFPRDRLANFMYLIEQKSGRVRVTRVRLDPFQKAKAWEPTDDRWKWEIAATSRAKDERSGDSK